ncbi:MAG: 6-bladed beta-propeller, partial [Gemmatimonadota bacterium]|nr:6-bladed beta-propeller [Gemmatimonadota bacterium]
GADAWRLSEDPVLTVGVDMGPEEYQFSDVSGILLFDDGSLVVADGGTREIRFFDSEGEFRNSTGGNGEGPGEFRSITGLGRFDGDSVWVYDFWLRRISIFDSEGQFGRTALLNAEIPRLTSLGRVSNGDFIFVQTFSSAGVSAENRLGLVRHPVAITAFNSMGEFKDTIGLYPGRELVLREEDGRIVMGMPPFGHNAVAAVGGLSVFVGDAEDYEVQVLGPTGDLQRILRRSGLELGISDADREAWIERLVSDVPSDVRPGLRAQLQDIPAPATRPAYSRIMADQLGFLWVAEYVHVVDQPRVWDVFGLEGQWFGSVETPENFSPLEIFEDKMVGVHKDDFDVERIWILPLKR